MRWTFFNLENSFVPSRKCEGGGDTFAGVIGSGITGIFQTAAAYDAQKEENKIQRKWQEDMYNKYQSPAALMRQYRQAGLNPFLMSEKGTAVGSIPSASQGGISPAPDYMDFTPDMFSRIELNAQTSGNQRAQSVLNMIMAVNDAFSKGGYKAGMSMIEQLAPKFQVYGLDEHTTMKMFESQRLEYDAEASIKQIQKQLVQEFGREKALTELESMNQQIAESVGRLGLMSSQADLNRAKENESLAQAKELGARLALDFAQAGYFKALGNQITQLTPYVAFNAMLGSGSLAMSYLSQEGEFSQNEYVRDWQHSNKAKTTRKYTNSMKPSNNVVGAFMEGFVSKVPTPWHSNSVDTWNNVKTEYSY